MKTLPLLAMFFIHGSFAPCSAQEVLKAWRQTLFPGTASPHLLPDLDGDGVHELLVGSGAYDVDGLNDVGIVAVYSGALVQRLFCDVGETSNFYLGDQIVAIGDMNGDGRRDYAASARGLRTYIYDGADGKVLFEHPHRSDRIVTLGDLDKDGYDEVALATRATIPIRVWIIRGGAFEVGITLPAPSGNPGFFNEFGLDFASLGDIDGDGVNDFVTGQNWVSSKLEFQGRLHAYSGKSGRSIYSVETGVSGAYAIEALGDLNGNGTIDLAVQWAGNEVGFLEGSDSSVIEILPGPNGYSDLADELLMIGDVNGSGCSDVLCSASKYNPQTNRYDRKYWVIDGGSRTVLLEFDAETGTYDAGFDWNGDGVGDFLRARGRWLEVVSIAPPWTTVFGEACSPARGEHLRILASGEPRIGGSVELRLADATPDRDAFLVLAAQGMQHASNVPGTGLCSLAFAPQRIHSTRTGTTGCGGAGATLTVPIPDLAALAGRSFRAQWLVSAGSPRAWATTRAMEIQLE